MKNYIVILFFIISLAALGQKITPGGVNGASVWLQVVPQTASIYGNYQWFDYSGDSLLVRRYDNRGAAFGEKFLVPQSAIRTFNFHPAINITDKDFAGEALIPYTNLSQASVFGVFCPYEKTETDMPVYSLSGRDSVDAFVFSKDKVIASVASAKPALDYGATEGEDLQNHGEDLSLFRERALRIASYMYTTLPKSGYWWQQAHSVLSLGGPAGSKDVNYTAKFDDKLLGNSTQHCYAPEIIVYNRMLNPFERVKVESYLGLKYGITMSTSYYDSQNRMLWNLDENPAYNHRVTAIIRDNISKLHQLRSVTSNEASPNFADSIDCFDKDSLVLTNRNRLLVIGRQQANEMQNGDYLIWGDNNETLTTSVSETYPDLYVMQRKWFVKTNIDSLDILQGRKLWQAQNLSCTEERFELRIVKPVGIPSGSAITTVPLRGKSGYVSFRSNSDATCTVKFGGNSNQLTTKDYGYQISPKGEIFTITKGELTLVNNIRVTLYNHIEICKEEQLLYLIVNGYRHPELQVKIAESDYDAAFYASIEINSDENKQIALEQVRYGGFTDTGSCIELAYSDNLASDFAQPCSKYYLLIDSSGSGNFQSGFRMIPSSEIDSVRKKIIFNNVFWDKDQNRKESFTFGFVPFLKVETVAANSTCTNNLKNADGTLTIRTEVGHPVYSYILSKQSGSDNQEDRTIRFGTFTANQAVVTGLSSDAYNLTVSQYPALNLSNNPQAQLSQAGASEVTDSCAIRWFVNDIVSVYDAGWTTPVDFSNVESQVRYGIYANKDKLYLIINGEKSTISAATIKVNDLIELKNIKRTLYVYLNNQLVHSVYLDRHQQVRLAAFVKFYTGTTSTLQYLETENMPSDWFGSHVSAQTLDPCRLHFGIQVGSDCTGNDRSIDKPNPEKSKQYVFNLTKSGDMYEASLEYVIPGQTMLLLFDELGQLVANYQMEQSGAFMKKKFRMKFPAVYILKVLSPDGEFTRKILPN